MDARAVPGPRRIVASDAVRQAAAVASAAEGNTPCFKSIVCRCRPSATADGCPCRHLPFGTSNPALENGRQPSGIRHVLPCRRCRRGDVRLGDTSMFALCTAVNLGLFLDAPPAGAGEAVAKAGEGKELERTGTRPPRPILYVRNRQHRPPKPDSASAMPSCDEFLDQRF
jgi:hypothetical protein